MTDLKDLIANDGTNIYQKALVNMHSYYVYDIEEPSNYAEWIEKIRMAGENDIIKFHINSYGGDLFTAIQLLRAMNESSATIIASCEGACMSAATLIFLAADQFEVSPHSMFMFHNYSGGAFGKGGEMMDQLVHERLWSEKLLQEVYSDFLTVKEIQSLLDNKDIWMDGDEVVDRLEKKMKKVQRTQKKKK